MITLDDLKANGYSGPYPANLYNADRLWQKRIRDDQYRTLYFINIYEYDIPGRDASFMPEVRFYRANSDGGGFNVECHERMSIEATETFFHDVYCKLGCGPDIHND